MEEEKEAQLHAWATAAVRDVIRRCVVALIAEHERKARTLRRLLP